MLFKGMVYDAMKEISDNMLRTTDRDGKLVCGKFTFRGSSYCINADGVLLIYKNKQYHEVFPSFCKHGIYPEYNLGGVPIKAYHISMMFKDRNFMDYYSGCRNIVVNHTVVDLIEGQSLAGTHKAAPRRELSYHPDYIEACTYSENRRHGAFIMKYRLYNTYVSAKDVEYLERNANLTNCFININSNTSQSEIDEMVMNNRSIILKYYIDRGETKKIIF